MLEVGGDKKYMQCISRQAYLQLGYCHGHIRLILQVEHGLALEVVACDANEGADGSCLWPCDLLHVLVQAQLLVRDFYIPLGTRSFTNHERDTLPAATTMRLLHCLCLCGSLFHSVTAKESVF